jgi:nitrogen fixation NifU-like protein
VKYSSIVIDHVKHPRNVGELEDANARARVRSVEDGDMLQLHMKIEGDMVREARFKVFGCGAAIAAGSMLTELIIGKMVPELRSITNQQLSEKMGGLPPEKIHCSILAEQAIHEALRNWEEGS